MSADGWDERRLFLAAASGIASHQVQSFAVEPEQRPLRVLALLGLGVGSAAFLRAPGPEYRARRGGVAIAVGALPAFGAVVGHVVPLVRLGRVEPASETAMLNLGCASMLLALGVSLLRRNP